MIAVVLAGVVAYGGVSARAMDNGCLFHAFSNNESSSGELSLYAETYKDFLDCAFELWHTKTEGWILGGFSNVTFCEQGGKNSAGACESYSTGDYSATTTTVFAYGKGSGWSNHWGRNTINWAWTDVATQQGPIYLDAGLPPRQRIALCEEMGYYGEYYYDDSGGTCVTYDTPILVPLTRSQDYKLTSAANGVQFDLDGDGSPERVAWAAADSRLAFLAIDRDGNGLIDSGKELFGNHTVPGGDNGFHALDLLNQSLGGRVEIGTINSDEPLFAKLLLWEDRNHNGFSEPSELQPATNVLAEIGLSYSLHNRRDGHGNLFRYRGWAAVRTAPGRNDSAKQGPKAHAERVISLYDVIFVK